MAADARRSPRQRVRLRVEFARAQDFVEQYAENLSAGGLFVRGAEGLVPMQMIVLKLALPGLGTFEVQAQVMHVLSQGAGGPGVGLAIRKAPVGFDDALTGYLLRLGNRKDVIVLVTGSPWRETIVDAGYSIAPLPKDPARVPAAVEAIERLAGIVVPEGDAAAVRDALRGTGKDSLVIAVADTTAIETVLDRLDGALSV